MQQLLHQIFRSLYAQGQELIITGVIFRKDRHCLTRWCSSCNLKLVCETRQLPKIDNHVEIEIGTLTGKVMRGEMLLKPDGLNRRTSQTILAAFFPVIRLCLCACFSVLLVCRKRRLAVYLSA